MKEKKCPLIKRACSEHDCMFYATIIGSDPQTGEAINRHQCSITMLPMLLIENSQQQRQTGASVDSFRNEMVSANHATAAAMLSNLKSLESREVVANKFS